MEESSPAQPGSRQIAYAWAVFLGTSWTWCIGMFLPVLLVRDYGVWGWVVFAVPNVIGAAAMGWVLGRLKDPREFMARHIAASTAFSTVTIAFHLFFIFWIVHQLIPGAELMALVVAAVIFLVGLLRPERDILSAAIVWMVSLVAFLIFLGLHRSTAPLIDRATTFSPDLIYLAPVCILGFFLNPYLDRTFNRAFLATHSGAAKMAFGLGFCVIFFLMIVFTLFYAPQLAPLVGGAGPWPGRVVAGLIAFHIATQSGFTIAMHLRPVTSAFGPLIRAAILAGVVTLFGWIASRFSPLGVGEATYRLFMGFYGLIFPAYAWLCMIPPRGGQSGPTVARFRALLLTLVIAGPMFWLAFIAGKMVWLVPAVAIVLLSRILVQREVGE